MRSSRKINAYLPNTRPVQTHPRPDPPRGSNQWPIRNRQTRLFQRSGASLGLQNPKTAGRLTGFLSKTRLNRDLSISQRSYLHPTRSQPFPARSQLDPSNLHWIWRDLTESDEISTNSKKIRRKYHQNFADFAVKLPNFGQFSNLQLQLNRPPSVEGPIRPIRSTMPIGDRLNF